MCFADACVAKDTDFPFIHDFLPNYQFVVLYKSILPTFIHFSAC